MRRTPALSFLLVTVFLDMLGLGLIVPRYDAGVAVARVHRLTGDRYGYCADRAHHAAWNVRLPVPLDVIGDVVARHGPVLDVVERPALLHFDLWDGNLLAACDSRGATRLTGLVDGERYLYGDPPLDLASPCLRRGMTGTEADARRATLHPLLEAELSSLGSAALMS